MKASFGGVCVVCELWYSAFTPIVEHSYGVTHVGCTPEEPA